MKELDVIYNRYGAASLRILDGGRIVSFPGKSIGFLVDENLFDYSGRYVGSFEKGVMRDKKGHVVGFGENPTDHPAPFFPFKQFKPFAGFVEFEPFRPFLKPVPPKPFKTYAWSTFDPMGLFSDKL